MPLKPVSMAPNSSLRASVRRRVRSPLPVAASVLTMLFMGVTMARISSTPQMIAATIASPSDTSMPASALSTAFWMLTADSSACCLLAATMVASTSRPA